MTNFARITPIVVAFTWVVAPTPAVAIPAAIDVSVRGLPEPKSEPVPESDFSRVRQQSPLQPAARPARPAAPITAVLSAPGSGAAEAPGTGEVEVAFRGMRFHPDRLVVSEGVQIRLINDGPVPLDLVSRGRVARTLRVVAGDSIRFAPGASGIYRYGAERWAGSALRIDIAPKGRLMTLRWEAGVYRFVHADLQPGPTRLRLLIGNTWHPAPEFILRDNNTLRLVFELEKTESGEQRLIERERREVPVELAGDGTGLDSPKRKAKRRKAKKRKRRKKRSKRKRRRRGGR
jgi:hypothetical protein